MNRVSTLAGNFSAKFYYTAYYGYICFRYKRLLTGKITYVNSVPSRLSDVTREDLDAIAVGPSDCRQVDAEAAVKLLVVGVHDGW